VAAATVSSPSTNAPRSGNSNTIAVLVSLDGAYSASPAKIAATTSGPSGVLSDGIVQLTLPARSVVPVHDCAPIASSTVCAGTGAGDPPSPSLSFEPSSRSVAVSVAGEPPPSTTVGPV